MPYQTLRVVLHGRIFLTSIFAYGNICVFFKILACYMAVPYCNILVFTKISVLHRRILGGLTQIFELTPQKYKLLRQYFFFSCRISSQKTPCTKKILYIRTEGGWRSPRQAGALFLRSATATALLAQISACDNLLS